MVNSEREEGVGEGKEDEEKESGRVAASPKPEITTGLGPTFIFKEPESGFLGPPKGEQMQGDQDVLTSFMQAGGET